MEALYVLGYLILSAEFYRYEIEIYNGVFIIIFGLWVLWLIWKQLKQR